MYLFFFILVLCVNVIVPMAVGADIYLALVFCFLNIVVYPVFLHILTTKTAINNVIIKDLTYSNYSYLSKTQYIVFECKKLVKYIIPWGVLIFVPFIINYLLDRTVFSSINMIDIFTIISLYNLAFLIVGTSSIIKNFYQKYFVYFYLLLGNVLLWSTVLDSYRETRHLLYTSLLFNLFCFFIGVLSLILEKKKKRISVA